MTTTQKKSKRKWLIAVIAIAVILAVLLLASRLLFRTPGGAANTAGSGVRSAEVTSGSITTSVSGSGTLVSAEAEPVTLPEGVEIETCLVSSGDRVQQGDALATVDPNSVLTTLAETQEQLNELDEQLEAKEDDTPPAEISAGVSGRVKQIYASADDSVGAVMAEWGSLMLLSLDGKMAVDLPASDAVTPGETVTVTLSDGSTEDGAIAERNSDKMVVTLTDNGPVNGDTVSVQAEDGSDLGSGELYIHSPLAITGYSGTVSSVKVSENETVSASTTLLKLTDLGHTAEYQALLIQRQELAEQLQTLNALYQNNVITAAFDGTVSSVAGEENSGSSVSDSSITASYSGGSGIFASVAEAEVQPQFVLLTSSSEPPEDAADSSGEAAAPGEEPSSPSESYAPVSLPLTAWVQLEGGAISDYTGQFTLTLLCNNEVVQTKQNDAGGKVVFDDLTFTAPGSYAFTLSQSAGTDSQLAYDTTVYSILVDVTGESGGTLFANVTVSPDTNSLLFTNAVSPDAPAQTPEQPSTPEDIAGGLGSLSGYSGPGGYSGLSGLNGTGGISTDATAALTTGDATSSTVAEWTALTISPDGAMTVSVSVDELDILSIQKGQEASVTIDALDGGPVSGTVTGIDTTGSGSGGVTKYTVEITVEKTAQMLANMNASVEIVIDEVENCLLIPEAALNQTGTKTYVYTGVDESTGELTGETEVTTGASDGTNVEILSGLFLGDTVCYSYTDASDEMQFGLRGRLGGSQ